LKAQNEKLKLALVGGGTTCLEVLQNYVDHQNVETPEIVAVADIDEGAVGYQFAKQLGMLTTTDYRDFYPLPDLNFIVELTGSNDVRDAIIRTKPAHIQLIDHVYAKFFWAAWSCLVDKTRYLTELSRTKDFLRTILDGIREDILVIDRDLNIVEVNKSYLEKRGLAREDVIDKQCIALFKTLGEPCLLEEGTCPLLPATRSNGIPSLSSTRRFRDKQGNVWHHEISAYPIRDDQGQITYTIKIIRDVTKTRGLEKRLRESEERYKKHVSRELHDGVGQLLNTMALHVALAKDELAESSKAALEPLSKVESLLQHTVDEVHRLAVNLRPSELDDLGLVSALRLLCKDCGDRTGIAIDLETNVADTLGDKDMETAVYRMVQEGLCNIEKHSHATRTSIKLDERGPQVILIIKDNGLGFDSGEASNKGMGLISIQERVSLLGGNVTVKSEKGRGTEIRIDILSKPESEELITCPRSKS
jgi:PAS domain S-box-containing protein